MSDSALTRARAGDQAAFAALTEPHRRELLVHCYRMLGSLQDAEDALQETLLAAWRGLAGFEERASLRTWLYRIATNRCLNARRGQSRRPVPEMAGALSFEPPPPSRMGDTPWLEPFPDEGLEGLPDAAPGPEQRYEAREAVGLAFVSALQRLPARQRAALVLRDVLGYPAAEAASMLEASEATVTSALQRARRTLEDRLPPARERAPAPGSPRERALAGGFADAFEQGDVSQVVALLTDDAWVTMPPQPWEYHGTAAVTAFLTHAATLGRRGVRTRLRPARANGRPAFGHYLSEPGTTVARGGGLLVLDMDDRGITMLTRFALGERLARFGLPAELPA